MRIKGMLFAATALGAALVASSSGCTQANRSDRATNGVAAQGENGANATQPAHGETMACTDVGGQAIEGLLTLDSPLVSGLFMHHGFVPPDPVAEQVETAPTCDAPLPMPPSAPSNINHYDSYTFTNASDAPSCISVRRGSNGGGNVGANGELIAYLNSFDPTDITKNYISDVIWEPAFSFTVPAHATFVIVVSAEETCIGCPSTQLQVGYTLSVTGCGQTESGGGSSSGGGGTSGGEEDAGGGGKSW